MMLKVGGGRCQGEVELVEWLVINYKFLLILEMEMMVKVARERC